MKIFPSRDARSRCVERFLRSCICGYAGTKHVSPHQKLSQGEGESCQRVHDELSQKSDKHNTEGRLYFAHL
jgi:hypothetical protein